MDAEKETRIVIDGKEFEVCKLRDDAGMPLCEVCTEACAVFCEAVRPKRVQTAWRIESANHRSHLMEYRDGDNPTDFARIGWKPYYSSVVWER